MRRLMRLTALTLRFEQVTDDLLVHPLTAKTVEGLSGAYNSGTYRTSEETSVQTRESTDEPAPPLMVWPVAISLSGKHELKVQLGKKDEDHEGLILSHRVIIVAGGGTVVSSGSVNVEGVANVRLSQSRMICQSLSGQLATRHPPTRPLTIFTTSTISGKSDAVDDEKRSRLSRISTSFSLAGASTTIVGASQEVATELELLFSRMAATYYDLENSPRVNQKQLLDIHGEWSIIQTEKVDGSGRGTKLKEDYPRLDGHERLSHDLPPWLMPPAQQRACERAWQQGFSPLMREMSYLLTCVPAAFGARQPSLDLGDSLQSTTWDKKEYSRTLMAVMAFLEHHKCWATLSSLLLHAEGIRVRVCLDGEVIKGENLEPLALQRILSKAAHGDLSVQCGLPGDSGQALGRTRDDACFENALDAKFEDWAEKWMKPGDSPFSSATHRMPAPASSPQPHRLVTWEILIALACSAFFVLWAIYRA